MDKQNAKPKVNRAVGRAKRQVEEWTDDAKDYVEEAVRQVKGKRKTVGTR